MAPGVRWLRPAQGYSLHAFCSLAASNNTGTSWLQASWTPEGGRLSDLLGEFTHSVWPPTFEMWVFAKYQWSLSI